MTMNTRLGRVEFSPCEWNVGQAVPAKTQL